MPNMERRSVVERHSPHFTEWDAFSPLSVGNGEYCYTADLTGTQTFDGFHQSGIPLLTEAQWAWHTAPYSNEQPVFDGSQFKLEEHRNGERNVPYVTSNDGQQAPCRFLRYRVQGSMSHRDARIARRKRNGPFSKAGALAQLGAHNTGSVGVGSAC